MKFPWREGSRGGKNGEADARRGKRAVTRSSGAERRYHCDGDARDGPNWTRASLWARRSGYDDVDPVGGEKATNHRIRV